MTRAAAATKAAHPPGPPEFAGMLGRDDSENARKVAARFEVSERTAKRAFDLMCDRMFAPLEYSAEH
jgi:hypothetical protein